MEVGRGQPTDVPHRPASVGTWPGGGSGGAKENHPSDTEEGTTSPARQSAHRKARSTDIARSALAPGTGDMRGTSRRREQREVRTCCAEPSCHLVCSWHDGNDVVGSHGGGGMESAGGQEKKGGQKEATAIWKVWGKRKNLDWGLASQRKWTRMSASLLPIVRHWGSLLTIEFIFRIHKHTNSHEN